MQPPSCLRLGAEKFGAEAACLGTQLAVLLAVVGEWNRGLLWFAAADVRAAGPISGSCRGPAPVSVGDTATLTAIVQHVRQFESGVLAGVPRSAVPRFRSGGLWTEDSDSAELGSAVVEFRAFDTSYWLVA